MPPPPPSPKFGDERLYSWWDEMEAYYCWVCLKHATEEHCKTPAHQRKAADALYWLEWNRDSLQSQTKLVKFHGPQHLLPELEQTVESMQASPPRELDSSAARGSHDTAAAGAPRRRSPSPEDAFQAIRKLQKLELKLHGVVNELEELSTELGEVSRMLEQ